MKYPFSVNTGVTNNEEKTEETTVLEGFIYERVDEPTVLFLHGNQETDSQKDMHMLANILLTKKLSSVTFDFSGFGSSTGDFANSTLEKRFEEAKDISPFLDPENSLMVCATGTNVIPAIKLTEFYNIKTLLLFAPNVENQKQDEEENKKYLSTVFNELEITKHLENFAGNLLIIKGKNDRIADKPVTNLYVNAFSNTYKKELLVIPNADHNIHKFLKDNTDAFKLMMSKVEKIL